MNELSAMIWVELRKALRSSVPIWTAVGSLFMPLGFGFLIFASKNPDIVQKLGLIGAKANLVAYAGTDWQTYLVLYAQIMAAGGFFLFVMAISWVFGREFSDNTVKDLLAVPVRRASILLAKFFVVAIWSFVLAIIIYGVGMLMGLVIQLPGAALDIVLRGSGVVAITDLMAIAVVLPFAFIASAGRGYLLPIGAAILITLLTNMVAIAGWGEYFPWAVPGLYAQGKDALAPVSFWIVIATGMVGMLVTYLWWKFADQNR